MEQERKEEKKIMIICAFIPAIIAACLALGYTFKIWPKLVQKKSVPAVKRDSATGKPASGNTGF